MKQARGKIGSATTVVGPLSRSIDKQALLRLKILFGPARRDGIICFLFGLHTDREDQCIANSVASLQSR